jgi:predicted RNA binding protein YcfA (HicA-like mRNA interferase family)/predicted RNase H-like HicB family nuclease
VPPKIRELIAQLENAGFADRGGKGSHRNYVHPKVARPITIAGKPGDDAKRYQVRAVAACNRGVKKMKDSAKYAKIVEWSDEDQCYVGSAPGLILGGCHGDDEKEVFNELCEVVEEAIAIYHKDGRTLPPPTSGRDFATKMQNVA